MSENEFVVDHEDELVTGLEVAKEFIPVRTRRLLYAAVSILGYLLSAVAVGFAAAGADIPVAVIVALAILGALIGPIGQLAASNTSPLTPLESGN